MPDKQFNFLENYVLEVLKKHGFNRLDEESQKELFPQFMAEAENRLGAKLLPHLGKEASQAFDELLKKEEVSADDLWKFWNTQVPNFVDLVKQTLEEFANEIGRAFAK